MKTIEEFEEDIEKRWTAPVFGCRFQAEKYSELSDLKTGILLRNYAKQ